MSDETDYKSTPAVGERWTRDDTRPPLDRLTARSCIAALTLTLDGPAVTGVRYYPISPLTPL
jgi:hypothetical protein